MANIPNFENKEFDDIKELRKVLTGVLNDLNTDANKTVVINLGKNVVLQWFDDGQTPPPRGYKKADGQNGTFDMSGYFTSQYYFIQKV